VNTRHRRQADTIDRNMRELDKVKRLLAQAWHACDLTLPDGYPTGGNEPVSGGDTSRPTEHAVIATEGRIESRLVDGEAHHVGMAAVDTSLRVINRAIAEIHGELSVLIAPLTRTDPPTRTNITECRACERPVTNTPDDRLRSGYCNACRMAWTRQGQPDRALFERNRAKHGGDQVRVTARDTGSGIELTVAGSTVRLPRHLADEFTALDIDAQVERLGEFHEAAVDWWERQA
jgi:hypothetical protein